MSDNNNVKSSKKWVGIAKIVVIVIITLFLVWFLLTKIDIDDVKSKLSEVQPSYIALGFVIYIFAYIFRSFRFYLLLGKKVGFKDLFIIVCLHNMINKILPARTGELSYIYLLKKYDIPLEERIATLVIARMFDFIIIACLFLISVIFLKDLPGIIVGVFWIIAIFLVILIVLLGSLLYFGDTFKDVVNTLAIRMRIHRFKITSRILKIIEDTIMSFETIKSRRIIIKTALLSAFIWMFLSFVYFSLIQAFQIELEFFEIIVIVSITALLPLLPIYALGGFGTTEVTLTGFFVAFGVARDPAIVVSFGIHIIGLIYTLILGFVGLLSFGFKGIWKKRASEQ